MANGYDKIKITNNKPRKENNMETLKNENCEITYEPNAEPGWWFFSGDDLTDTWNLPRMVSTSRRGHKKAWEAVKSEFNENTTMFKVIEILMQNGIKTHYWYAMD